MAMAPRHSNEGDKTTDATGLHLPTLQRYGPSSRIAALFSLFGRHTSIGGRLPFWLTPSHGSSSSSDAFRSASVLSFGRYHTFSSDDFALDDEDPPEDENASEDEYMLLAQGQGRV